jgi:hypothetical protein
VRQDLTTLTMRWGEHEENRRNSYQRRKPAFNEQAEARFLLSGDGLMPSCRFQ